jgi:hypothetical protein
MGLMENLESKVDKRSWLSRLKKAGKNVALGAALASQLVGAAFAKDNTLKWTQPPSSPNAQPTYWNLYCRNNSSSNNVADYRDACGIIGNSPFKILIGATVPTSMEFLVPGIPDALKIHYRVAACNSVGCSAPTNDAYDPTTDTTLPVIVLTGTKLSGPRGTFDLDASKSTLQGGTISSCKWTLSGPADMTKTGCDTTVDLQNSGVYKTKVEVTGSNGKKSNLETMIFVGSDSIANLGFWAEKGVYFSSKPEGIKINLTGLTQGLDAWFRYNPGTTAYDAEAKICLGTTCSATFHVNSTPPPFFIPREKIVGGQVELVVQNMTQDGVTIIEGWNIDRVSRVVNLSGSALVNNVNPEVVPHEYIETNDPVHGNESLHENGWEWYGFNINPNKKAVAKFHFKSTAGTAIYDVWAVANGTGINKINNFTLSQLQDKPVMLTPNDYSDSDSEAIIRFRNNNGTTPLESMKFGSAEDLYTFNYDTADAYYYLDQSKLNKTDFQVNSTHGYLSKSSQGVPVAEVGVDTAGTYDVLLKFRQPTFGGLYDLLVNDTPIPGYDKVPLSSIHNKKIQVPASQIAKGFVGITLKRDSTSVGDTPIESYELRKR